MSGLAFSAPTLGATLGAMSWRHGGREGLAEESCQSDAAWVAQPGRVDGPLTPARGVGTQRLHRYSRARIGRDLPVFASHCGRRPGFSPQPAGRRRFVVTPLV